MKALGKQEAETEYKQLKHTQDRETKNWIKCMKEQHTTALQEKEAELQKFVAEFKEYHQNKKDEIHEARRELVSLYQHCQKQSKCIKYCVDGKYTQGKKSVNIPIKERVKPIDLHKYKYLVKVMKKGKQLNDDSDDDVYEQPEQQVESRPTSAAHWKSTVRAIPEFDPFEDV